MIVKICGITSTEDARAAVDAGATALGFNFWPRSPRHVTAEQAAGIVRTLPSGVWRVGVFVDEPAAAIEELAGRVPLDIVQLHGSCGMPRGLRVWKAVAAGDAVVASPEVEAFLVDAPAGGERGGSGRTFDWKLAARLEVRVVLAGGLEASNVAEAIAVARPWGVDACSRLESAPGRKDHAKVREFIAAAAVIG